MATTTLDQELPLAKQVEEEIGRRDQRILELEDVIESLHSEMTNIRQALYPPAAPPRNRAAR